MPLLTVSFCFLEITLASSFNMVGPEADALKNLGLVLQT
jgi:hypothetical protein